MFRLNIAAEAAAASGKLSVGPAVLYAILGYGVVFIGLVLLMCVIIIVGKVMVASQKKKAVAVVPAAPEVTKAVEAPKGEPAPGSAGGVMIHDVSERDAAMIMAIVADKMGKPLNEIRFKSIKEVK